MVEDQKRRIAALHRRRIGAPHAALNAAWAGLVQWSVVSGVGGWGWCTGTHARTLGPYWTNQPCT